MNGYYEWEAPKKIPNFIYSNEHDLIYALAIGDLFHLNGHIEERFCIITRAANKNIAHIHDRMPALISKDAISLWLDDNTTENTIKELLISPQPALSPKTVSNFVNKISNNSERCLAPPRPPNQPELF